MALPKLEKWQKICIALCGVGILFSILLFVPIAQNLILDFGENFVVHRPLTRPVWIGRFVKWGREWCIFFIILSVVFKLIGFTNPFLNFNVCICKMHEKKIERILLSCIISGAIFSIVLIRACFANVWWDEGATYFWYVLPLSEISSLQSALKTIFNFYFNSSANNHLLNSILIAFFTKLSNIYYEEIVLRLPTVLVSLLYLYVLGYLFVNKRINFPTYLLLSCNSFFC